MAFQSISYKIDYCQSSSKASPPNKCSINGQWVFLFHRKIISPTVLFSLCISHIFMLCSLSLLSLQPKLHQIFFPLRLIIHLLRRLISKNQYNFPIHLRSNTVQSTMTAWMNTRSTHWMFLYVNKQHHRPCSVCLCYTSANWWPPGRFVASVSQIVKHFSNNCEVRVRVIEYDKPHYCTASKQWQQQHQNSEHTRKSLMLVYARIKHIKQTHSEHRWVWQTSASCVLTFATNIMRVNASSLPTISGK